LSTVQHDNWPSLRVETVLYTGKTSRVANIIHLVKPSYRRAALADKILEDIRDAVQDILLPLELKPQFDNGAKFSEDDPWTGQIEVKWCFEEFSGIFAIDQIERVCIRYKSIVASKDLPELEPETIDFTAYVSQSNGALSNILRASTEGKIGRFASYAPVEAIVWIRGGLQAKAMLRERLQVIVVERLFPWVVDVVCPVILASGTHFNNEKGENDSVSVRQEFLLRISKCDSLPSDFEFLECEASLTCTDGFEFAEKEGKMSSKFLNVVFQDALEKPFSIIVTSKHVKDTGGAQLYITMKTIDGRVSPVKTFDLRYETPISVSHLIRFAGNDAVAVSLSMSNHLQKPHEGLEVLSCSVSNVSSDSTKIMSSDLALFPFQLKVNAVLRQSFLLHEVGSLVPERVGGRSLVLLNASIVVRFMADSTQATLSWFIPLLIRRAEVVRSRWKAGETLSFSPPIEEATFGMDWADIDDEAPAISVNDIGDAE